GYQARDEGRTTMTFIRDWLPPVVRRAGNRALGGAITFQGPFANWADARNATTGYDQPSILARVEAATREVLEGRAVYEQDGVAFTVPPPPSDALVGLLLAAARSRGKLSVLDFGGALASHFLRWRPVLSRLCELRWSVVEQPAFVSAGRTLFAGIETVSFHAEVRDVDTPNTVLVSSALQYRPDPIETLRYLRDLGCEVII